MSKNIGSIGLAAVIATLGTFLAGCAEEPTRFPHIGATGAPEQGSTIAATAEHGARAAVNGIENGVGFTLAILALMLLPFAVFILIPRCAAGDAEEPLEGLLIVAVGIAGIALTWGFPSLVPWFGALIWAGLSVATVTRGGAKWVLFILFDIVLGIWLLVRLVSWGLTLPPWLKLVILLLGIVCYTVHSAGSRATAKA
jgi:hypothetical protein